MLNVSKLLKVLGDENRLKMLTYLSQGELSVCEMMQKMNMSQPTVSHHLKILKNLELIKSRKSGKWIYYRIDIEKARLFQEKLDELFDNLIGNSYCSKT